MNWYDTRHELIIKRMKLDRFFTLFLDKFEKQMHPEKTDTKIWKLYKAKLKEYDDVQRGIKAAEYWINKDVQHG